MDMKVVFVGDSLTVGANVSNFAKRLTERLPIRYPRINWTFKNNGQGSRTSQWMIGNIATLILDEAPDIVTLMFGNNDQAGATPNVSLEQFEANLKSAIDQTRSVTNTSGKNGGVPVILLLTNGVCVTQGQATIEKMPQYAATTRKVAKEKQTYLVDLFSRWWAWSAYNGHRFTLNTLNLDGVHPTDRGWDVVYGAVESKVVQIMHERFLGGTGALYGDSLWWRTGAVAV